MRGDKGDTRGAGDGGCRTRDQRSPIGRHVIERTCHAPRPPHVATIGRLIVPAYQNIERSRFRKRSRLRFVLQGLKGNGRLRHSK